MLNFVAITSYAKYGNVEMNSVIVVFTNVSLKGPM